MKTIIRTYFTIVSSLFSKLAAKQAMLLFQTPRRVRLKKNEVTFFETSHNFKVPYYLEDIDCYELGDSNGKLVLLVHGWDSNAGSLAGIAQDLANKGYLVVTFNLPAHGFSKLKRTNLKFCREAFQAVLDYINPSEKFSVVAHSFGSAVTTFSLSNSRYKADKLVFLTNPNKISNIFYDFKNFIGLGKLSYQYLLEDVKNMLGEPVDKISIEDYSKQVKYNQLLLIHDYYDKVLPYQNSVDVRSKWQRSEMITFHKIGHYRMLWNEEVIQSIIDFLATKTININSEMNVNSMVS